MKITKDTTRKDVDRYIINEIADVLKNTELMLNEDVAELIYKVVRDIQYQWDQAVDNMTKENWEERPF